MIAFLGKKWIKATAGWGEPSIDKSVGSNKLNIDGKDYQNGIGTHAPSVIEFDIPEGYDSFSTKAGLDRECIQHSEGASVRFLVFTQDPAGSRIPDSLKVPVKLEQLGLHGSFNIKDLWNNKNLGNFNDEFAPFIKNHGAGLYRISREN